MSVPEDMAMCRRCGEVVEEQDMCPVPGPPFEVCVWCVEDRAGEEPGARDHGEAA